MTLSEKIYYSRKKMGKSQEALADELGVSRQAVSKWEMGECEPDLANLRALAAVFDVTVDFLLSDEAPTEDSTLAEETLTQTKATSEQTWVDALPGAIGRLVSRYGWLGGVYLAVAGGIIALMGIALFFIMGSITTTINTQMSGFGGISTSVPQGMYTPMYIIGGLFLVIGLGMTVTGVILALKLKNRNKK